jgi:histidyl-tRNA synthetase
LGALKESLRIVQELRKNKIPSEIDLTKRGISKNLDYANSLGIPYVLIIGENELKAKKLKLKNMQSGDEKLVTEKELIKYLKNN